MARTFDVICAGEALEGGGVVGAARALAARGLRVGLATVLDDAAGARSLRQELEGEGIDVEGVLVARPTSTMVLVRGGARQRVAEQEQAEPVSVPAAWRSNVLLLSGLSPIVAHNAALCRAARAARRAGSVVVVDVNVKWERWVGRDARAVRMTLREADVVWATPDDMFGLDMNEQQMRDAIRPGGMLRGADGDLTSLCADLARTHEPHVLAG